MWPIVAEWLLKGIPPLTIIGGLAYAYRQYRQRRDIYLSRARYVDSLPFECRCVLMEFVVHGSRTELPSWNRWVEILEGDGVIRRHCSAGKIDAVSYIFAIDPDFLAFLKSRPPVEPPKISEQ
jgi:hypothetical protein